MRVLMLTWEFPPIMTGGLGMACYGMTKALLSMGIEVDLIIPTNEEVYFRLRKPEDADLMPVVFIDASKKKKFPGKINIHHLVEGAKYLDMAYFITGERTFKKIWEEEILEGIKNTTSLEFLFDILSKDGPFFPEVRNYTAKAVNIAKQLNYDVIHSHDWLTYPAALLIKGLSEKPWISHIHSTEFDRAGGAGDSRIHNIEYMGTRLADKIITVSSYTSNIIVEKYMADRNKIRIAHNAFVMEETGKPKKRIFKEPTVVFIGRITLQKGPDYFLQVAKKVLQKEKKVRFIMAGKGDMERGIIHHSASLGLGTKFLFSGFLSRQELESILSAADIFVMPSVSEPFGIAPLEAMSHGTVAIISKQSGVAEIIENAYKVDFWDIDQIASIILDLIRNPEKLKQMSQSSLEEVAKIRWKETARKILDVYNESVRS
jgi:glycogen(starch) synthase